MEKNQRLDKGSKKPLPSGKKEFPQGRKEQGE